MRKLLKQLGQYFIMMSKVFSMPEMKNIFFKKLSLELEKIGLDSLGIVTIISFFIGAVVSIQTAFNFESPLFPKYLIGYATRESLILEFCPTMLSLILAGKVGSNIASEIGSMRITEQIDALEIMGVNSASFLILPKLFAAVLFFPILIILGISIGIVGGWIGCQTAGITAADYIYGIKYEFNSFYVTYCLIKTTVFAFIIATVSSYFGYHTKGGALEVGKASTRAVVYSSIIILIFNFILTDLLLA
ncbi:MAG: ABC transporter permease [Flavobacteriales bacterium]|nr:ABC transporter permease [Flavobacteriales bacterium]